MSIHLIHCCCGCCCCYCVSCHLRLGLWTIYHAPCVATSLTLCMHVNRNKWHQFILLSIEICEKKKSTAKKAKPHEMWWSLLCKFYSCSNNRRICSCIITFIIPMNFYCDDDLPLEMAFAHIIAASFNAFFILLLILLCASV